MWFDSPSEAGKISPRHIHSSGRLQSESGRLCTQLAHVSSVTMAGGCSRLVRMMLGYLFTAGGVKRRRCTLAAASRRCEGEPVHSRRCEETRLTAARVARTLLGLHMAETSRW